MLGHGIAAQALAAGSRWVRRLGWLAAAVPLAAMPAQAGDWPAVRHDAQRSAVTDETLTFPLRQAWRYVAAQPPRPAWPDSFHMVNRLDFDYAPQVVVAQGLLFFGSSADDTVRALDARTGQERWQFVTGGPVRFAPQIDNNRAYFGSDDGFIYCVEATSGKLLWRFRGAPTDERQIINHRMISRWPIRTGTLVADGVVYAVAGLLPAEGVYVHALDAASGKPIWCNDTCSGTPQGALLLGGDVLLIPNSQGRTTPLDRRTGAVMRFGAADGPAGWLAATYERIPADPATNTPAQSKYRGGATGRGGTWVTVDGNKEYSFAIHRANVLMIEPYSLATGLSGRPWGTGVVPQLSLGPQVPSDRFHDRGKVSAIVSRGRPYARKAYGIAMAGNSLLLGLEGSVVAERSEVLKSADLRFALTGDDLLVHAAVVEKSVTQAAKPWKGSCVEIFGSRAQTKEIGQVFLVPQTATEPARAFLAQNGGFVPAPQIGLRTTPTAVGYDLVAKIPLSLLALDKASPEFLIEAQVTVTGPDNTVQRDTLFGSTAAYQDNQRFGRLRLRRFDKAPELDRIKATLVGEVSNPIAMSALAELWRAPVGGQARELAVADQRLFVATDRGEIYCFAPAGSEAAAGGAKDPAAQSSAASKAPPTAQESAPASAVVEQLLAAGQDRGYALVLGDADAALAQTLAARTQLHVILAATDESQAAAMRNRLLAKTAFYGSRVHVQTLDRLDRLPFARYFANAVIVSQPMPGLSAPELYRVLRPCGGVLLLPGIKAAARDAIVKSAGAEEDEIRPAQDGPAIVRGKLPGALDWDTDRKLYTADQRVKWPLRPLWIGGPTTRQVQFFHGNAAGPTTANGRYFMVSERALTAIDAYNGAILWSRPIPQAVNHTREIDGVLYSVVDRITATRADGLRALRVDDHYVYLTMGAAYFQGKGTGIVQIDARTGRQARIQIPFNPPTLVPLTAARSWPLEVDPTHAGSVTLEPKGRGLLVTLVTKDPAVTRLDGWDLLFDVRPADRRYGLYGRGAFHVRVGMATDPKRPPTWVGVNGEAFPALEVSGSREADGSRTAVLLPWTEIEKLGGGRAMGLDFAATLNAHDGGLAEPIKRLHLFANWSADAVNNGWARLRFDDAAASTQPAEPPVALTAPADAGKAAAKPGRTDRGVISIADVTAQPGVHPLTGEPVPKVYGVGPMCGPVSTAANLFFGQGRVTDLEDNSGMRSLNAMTGVKSGCTSPQLAALGMVIISEEMGHCICNYALHTTVALAEADRRLNEDWARFYDRDVDTQIRQAHLNLGAPGDRRDDAGDLWLGFPRASESQSPEEFPNPDHPLPYPLGMRDAQTGLWYRRSIRQAAAVPMEVKVAQGFGAYRFSADRVAVSGTDRPWIYTSGYRGLLSADLRLNFHRPLASIPVTTAPAIDGKLGEPTWSASQPSPEAEPALPYTATRVLFRHDSTKLYVGVQRPPMIRWDRTERVGATAGYKAQPLPWQTASAAKPAGPTVDRLGRVLPGAGTSTQPAPKPATKPAASPAAPQPPAAEVTNKVNFWRLIVSDRSQQKAIYLSVTPDGTRFAAVYDEARKERTPSWSGAWESAVVADERGMSLEMAIPWASIQEAGLNKDELAVNFMMFDPGLGAEALVYMGFEGFNHCTNFTPLGLGAPAPIAARAFTVRLHFAEPDEVKPGQRVFDVKLQGQPVLKNFDVAKEAGRNAALVKEFKNVRATQSMTLELVPSGQPATPQTVPIISAIELREEGVAPVATKEGAGAKAP